LTQGLLTMVFDPTGFAGKRVSLPLERRNE